MTSEATAPLGYARALRRPAGAWWRLGVVMVLGVVGLLILPLAAILLTIAVARRIGYPDFTFDVDNGIDAGEMLAANAGLASLIALSALTVWLLYGARARSLSSVRPGIRWPWLGLCAGIASVVWVPLLLLAGLGAYIERASPLDLGVVAFVVVVVLTTPLQAAGEEYLFRGLLLQALGATRLPLWACCGISGLLFATAHAQFAPPLFADRLLLGCVLAWLVVRTGGLEAGIAIHAVKNIAVLIPAGLLGAVDDALDPTGVTWVPFIVDLVLLALVVPWILSAYKRRERASVTSTAPAGWPPPPPG